MYCRICGTHRTVEYRRRCFMDLCAHCNSETPKKASRYFFDKRYWSNPDDIPESVKKEFYSDYKVSRCTVAQYIEQTTTRLD